MPESSVRSPLAARCSPSCELSGPPAAPVVVVLGGISATRHVTATATDPSEGWWQEQVGPGAAIDTRQVRVLGVDWHTDCDGPVTTVDQAHAVAATLDTLGIDRIAAFVGASYGGMVALAFAAEFPDRVERLAIVSAAHRSHPMATAHRVIQRRIVELGIAGGLPTVGLALARALGVTTYRTAAEFRDRFDGAAEVSSYLQHQGDRFASRWDPARYLALSASLDSHQVDPARITTPAALLGVREDTLVPIWQLRELRDGLGGPCRLDEVSSIYGHDAFLKEGAVVSRFLIRALDQEVRRAA